MMKILCWSYNYCFSIVTGETLNNSKGKSPLTDSGQGKGFEENTSRGEKVACWHERSFITLVPDAESQADNTG